MDILNSNSYCIWCTIAVMLVKTKFKKTTLKLLYISDYLLSNHTKSHIKFLKNSNMYRKTMLRYGRFKFLQLLYIVFYSYNECKNQNLKTTLNLLCIIDNLLFNDTKLDINLLTISVMYPLPKLRYGHFKSYCILCSIALLHVKIKI